MTKHFLTIPFFSVVQKIDYNPLKLYESSVSGVLIILLETLFLCTYEQEIHLFDSGFHT